MHFKKSLPHLLSPSGEVRIVQPSSGWIVAIAASAGGLPPIRTLLAGLPANFPAPVMVLMHIERTRPSTHLADIFERVTAMSVEEAREGARMLPGHVYVCVPNQHMVLRSKRTIGLDESALVHFLRPAADVLFPSIADQYGPRAIAVVLSGTGRDGASGAAAVAKAGGVVIAQDEETSEAFGMPSATIANVAAAEILPIEAISAKILSLVGNVRS